MKIMKACRYKAILLAHLIPIFSIVCSDSVGEYKYIECKLAPITRAKKDPWASRVSHPIIPPSSTLLSKKRLDLSSSTNWSGYVTWGKIPKGSVSAVYGSWTIPAIKPTITSAYCGIWVGIDGYLSDTVEQIGTGHDWSQGKSRHYAWVEMYPGPSMELVNFPVKQGDVISASVEYKNNGVFLMKLFNSTKKVTTTIPTAYTTSPNVKRSSAEWIVEAPWAGSVLPLSNFGTVTMSNCGAVIDGTTMNLNNVKLINTQIKMVSNIGVVKAVPSAIKPSNNSFSVTWKHQ